MEWISAHFEKVASVVSVGVDQQNSYLVLAPFILSALDSELVRGIRRGHPPPSMVLYLSRIHYLYQHS